MEFKAIAEQIINATDYLQVFGPVPDDQKAEEHVKRVYLQMVRLLHPDRHVRNSQLFDLATRAFVCFGDLYEQAKEAAENGTYGATTLAVISTKRAEHRLVKPLGSGDLTSTYASETMPKTGSSSLSFCKIAKQAADADLMQAEVTALKQLRAEGTNTHMHAFVPELLDTFVFQQTGKPKLQANVLTRLEGFCNLTEVHRVYAQGLHPLHVGWIWRRLLYVLGYSHQQEVVHGAVLPTPCHGFVGRLRRCFG